VASSTTSRPACTRAFSVMASGYHRPRRPTPISPPFVKSTDLLRSVVESRRLAAVSHAARITAVPFKAVFVSSAGTTSRRRSYPTPIEAHASRSEVRGAGVPRGLETHSGPHTGLLMTSDVAARRMAHPLSSGSGEGQPILETRVHGGGGSGRPIIRARCRTPGS
jgi:hypothetical protein